jgi:hypothetical protein
MNKGRYKERQKLGKNYTKRRRRKERKRYKNGDERRNNGKRIRR